MKNKKNYEVPSAEIVYDNDLDNILEAEMLLSEESVDPVYVEENLTTVENTDVELVLDSKEEFENNSDKPKEEEIKEGDIVESVTKTEKTSRSDKASLSKKEKEQIIERIDYLNNHISIKSRQGAPIPNKITRELKELEEKLKDSL